MVSFRPYGRLGNYMFMASNCIAYSLEHGLEFSMPKHTTNEFWKPIYLSHLQHPDYQQGREDILINEPSFSYTPHEFKEEWRDKYIIFNGYFQSELYFKKYREEILYIFGFKWEQKPIISLHARYGDYLTVRNAHGVMKHIILDEPYIKAAIDYVKGKTGLERIKVFSDNIPLFKERHGNLYDFEYSTNTNEIDDLVEMSCCHSNIGSSSTFSWWGAWLNRNPEKVIVTQSEWFTPNWDGLDTSNIIPDTWIKL